MYHTILGYILKLFEKNQGTRAQLPELTVAHIKDSPVKEQASAGFRELSYDDLRTIYGHIFFVMCVYSSDIQTISQHYLVNIHLKQSQINILNLTYSVFILIIFRTCTCRG